MIKRCNPGHINKVLNIFKDASVHEWITDDSPDDVKTLDRNILNGLHNLNNYFLMPREGTVMMLLPVNFVMYDIHMAAVEGDGRRHASKDAFDCLLWMVENTSAKKFMTMIPTFNRITILFARRCGEILAKRG